MWYVAHISVLTFGKLHIHSYVFKEYIMFGMFSFGLTYRPIKKCEIKDHNNVF